MHTGDERREPSDPDQQFADELATFDEMLRRGGSTALLNSHARGGDAATAARMCLQLLEEVYPRAGTADDGPAISRIGRFETIKLLGQGGFGVVYLARDSQLDRLVAIKVPRMHEIGDRGRQDRLLREARAAALLDHPHIVPVLETGDLPPVCYIASTYCEGGDLREWLQQHGPVSSRSAARLIALLADAVQYSHGRGMLHRDIKPSNVLLASPIGIEDRVSDEIPFVPRLCDFGLAKILEDDANETGSMLLGTPAYMAPEQTAKGGIGVGPATDVHALGTILYELLTGRPPYQGAGFVEVIDQVRTADPVPPTQLVKSIARDLETICLKCLAKSPARRYPSAAALKADLNAFLECRVISARPAGPVEILSKGIRRHPLTAVFITLTSIAACALILLQWRHATVLNQQLGWSNQLRQQTEKHRQHAEQAQQAAEAREADLLIRESASAINWASHDLFHGRYQDARRRIDQLREAMVQGQNPVKGIEPEWNFLCTQAQGPTPERVFSKHGKPVYSLAIAPDGETIASGDASGTIKIWRRSTGDEITTLSAHEGEVRALAFSPDGQRLASGGQFHHMKIWDTRDWKTMASVDAHDGTITCLAWRANDEFVASGGRDGMMRLWKSSDLTKLREIEVGDVVNCIRIPGSRIGIWTSDKSGRISQWTLSGKLTRTDVFESKQNVHAFDVTTDEEVFCCWGFAIPGKRKLFATQAANGGSAVLSQNCNWAAREGEPGVVDVWRWIENPLTSVCCQQFSAHSGSMHSMIVTPDGTRLITSSLDGTVKVWRIGPTEDFAEKWLIGSGSAYNTGMAFSKDERLIALSSDDGFIRVFECKTGRHFDSLNLHDQRLQFKNVSFASDRETLISQTNHPDTGTGLLLWRPGSNQPYRTIVKPGISDVSISSDGSRMAVVREQNKSLEVWDTHLMQSVQSFQETAWNVNRATISPDGKRLAAVGDAAIFLIDIETGVVRKISDFKTRIYRIAFDPSGSRLAVLSEHPTLTLLDIETGTILDSRYGVGGTLQASDVCFSPDGAMVALSLYNANDQNGGHVEIWSLATHRQILTLKSYHLGVGKVRYSPGGRYLAGLLPSPDQNINSGVWLWRFQPPRGFVK